MDKDSRFNKMLIGGITVAVFLFIYLFVVYVLN
jgi:hypothetical protein